MRVLFLLSVTLFPALAHTQSIDLESKREVEVNIPSQPLDQALNEFGGQTGLILAVATNAGADKITSVPIIGFFTPKEALKRLLTGTGWRAEHFGEHGVLVKPPNAVIAKKNDNQVSQPGPVEQVVVTGTHIPGTPPDASSVITTAQQDIDRLGALTADQLARSDPRNFNLVNSNTSTGASINPQTGFNVARGAAFNLRGLGPGATLILLNGQRLAPGGYDGSFVDISMIPLVAIDRVEVLPDAASAIYGSDAIAGVVNYVMRSNYDGFEVTPSYRDVTSGGGRERGLSQLAGHEWSSGGAMLAYQNDQQQAVNASTRNTLVPQPGPYQAIPLESTQNGFLTLHQTVTKYTALSADGFYSQRNSAQQYLSEPLTNTQSVGMAKMSGGSVTAAQSLPGQWHTDGVGSYAQEDENVRTSATQVEQFYRTHATSASVEARASGPLQSIPGGSIKLSVGTSYRWETFNDYVAAGSKREVLGEYAEAFVPLVSELNAIPAVKRFELSLAVRRDAYRNDQPGVANVASDNPKIGLTWSPQEMVKLRGTYATSFRVAPLAQLNASKDSAALFPLPNPNVPGAVTNTLYITGGNSALRPEVARTFTTGFELTPDSRSDASFSVRYFHVRYDNRIAAPPVVGPITSIYSQLATLSPYIDLSPSKGDIQAAYSRYSVSDPDSIGQAGVQAIFNASLQNIASTEESGVETALKSTLKTRFGDLKFFEQGQYLSQLNYQAAPTTAYVPVLGTVFNPPRLRMQAGTDWSYKHLEAFCMLDYTSSFRDTLTPGVPHVASWLTLNSSVSYTTGPRFAGIPGANTTFTLTVNNLADRPAPFVNGLSSQTLGYDPTNATVLGRAILFEIHARL
jgi:iron complex outermembrane receptor protein